MSVRDGMVARYTPLTPCLTRLQLPLPGLFSPVVCGKQEASYTFSSCTYSTLQTRATELVPEQRGTAIAIFAFVLVLGSGLGTYVAGQAIERLGFTPTLLGTAAVLAIFTAIAGPLLRVGQSAEE
jgi:predicted MFS family arabinose efflux permease